MTGTLALILSVTHAAAALIAFAAGYRKQLKTILAAAEELGPGFVELVNDLRKPKAK